MLIWVPVINKFQNSLQNSKKFEDNYEHEAHDNDSVAFNQTSDARFYQTEPPPLFQQHYACQKCNFFSSNPRAILAHLNNAYHLNARIQSVELQSPFQRVVQPLNYTPTLGNPHLISSNLI
jgi:hypothetical protein